MVPWQKLPDDLQKAVLALVVLSGSGAVASCRPMVCDPAPPPRTSPTPTMTPTSTVTPMICDPAPPPTITRTPTITPMICDPAPPPTATPTPTMTPMICDPPPPPNGKPSMTPMLCDPPPQPDLAPRPKLTAEAALPGFEASSIQIIPDRVQEWIEVRGTVRDRLGNPVPEAIITLLAPGFEITSGANDSGVYSLHISAPGAYRIFVGADRSHSVPLDLKLHDLATVDWVAVRAESRAPLPLAEIRTVKIAQVTAGSAPAHNLVFAAASPWPNADCHWTVSGGTLTASGPRVRWQPPVEPGRYLLQVVADWDFAGLAVDAVVLAVAADGRVTIS
jgi:hypothetical protein